MKNVSWQGVLRAAALTIALFRFAPASAAETITYSYDALGRLVAVSHSGTVNNGELSNYTYDQADNRSTVTVTGK